MPDFLQKVAKDVLANHQDLQKVAIILPSRRAAVFLKKAISEQIETPHWSPIFSTSEDFMLEQLGWQVADRATLLFKLYDSYREVAPAPAETFKEFSQWASLMLNDFNEIDRYLIDYQQLFTYLADLERIKKWDLKGGEPSEMLRKYLRMWDLLPLIYQRYTEKLKSERVVYQGLAYREVSDNLDAILPRLRQTYDKLLFVGFNALNKAEEHIFNALYAEGIAAFYWDTDAYYLDDPNQESGMFLRRSELVKTLRAKGEFNWISNQLLTAPKKLEIISANGSQEQAIIANKMVGEATAQNQEEIALVMADENLLPPFLNNLTAQVDSLNITMGLPLKGTAAAAFFQIILEMFKSAESNPRQDKNGRRAFHHRFWSDLLSKRLTKTWVKDNRALGELQNKITQRNQIFISAHELNEWVPGALGEPVIEFFSKRAATPNSDTWLQLAKLAERIHLNLKKEATALQPLFGFFRVFNRLSQLTEEFPYFTDWSTATKFYRDLIDQESLDLRGDPLSGLQVMGMLETRTLEFERVILTSVNEDVLPQGRTESSLIPHEIRREFGLPTYLEKDAVFAYHFYRLIQNAKEVFLIYNSASDGLNTGEPSRFINQLVYELQERNHQVEISYRHWNFPVRQSPVLKILKTPFVVKSLEGLAQKGVSPTALIDYVNDATEFYRKRILKLRDINEVEEVAGFDKQGNVIHKLLEEFYTKFVGTSATEAFHSGSNTFDITGQELRPIIEDRLRQETGLYDFKTGKNLIIREILTSMTRRFLREEQNQLKLVESAGDQITLIGLEQNYEASISLSNGRKVLIKGNIDRIDRLAGQTRIIDYKTGSVESRLLSFTDFEKLRQPKEGNKSLQLMVYAWLYMRNNPQVESLQAGIISLRNTKSWLLPLKFDKDLILNKSIIDDFEEFLKDLLEEIFDPGLAFEKKPLTLQSDE